MGALTETAASVERAAARLGRRLGGGLRVLPRALSGYYRLPRQRDLLRATDWNVLVILDACRADSFRRVEWRGVRTIRSMGPCTRVWIRHFGRLVRESDYGEDVLWCTANPLIDSARVEYGVTGVRLMSVWRRRWERLGRSGIPSVHPDAVNDEVLRYVREHGQPRRMIVHYLQPHSPYVGRTELGVARWGRSLKDPLSDLLRGLKDAAAAVADGELTWDLVRRAYEDNVRLVWDATRRLAEGLKGSIIVTSDHGEVLGEGGRWGHTCAWQDEVLRLVPWLELDRGPFEPAPLAAADDEAPEELVRERLEYLGYL
jgi:hypothetical protein